MFPAKFEYYRAESVADALRLLGEHDEAKLLAGGHSLIPMMKLRLAQPAALIDIGRVAELKGLSRHGTSFRIGALTTHAELEHSVELARHCPLISEAAAKIADPAVRNKGTIGGSIAHADPASDLPAVLLALDATMHLQSAAGSRTVAAKDFFVGLMTTDVGEGELLTAIDIPALTGRVGTAYLKVEHPASGYAICGAAARLELDRGDRCSRASLCFNGVTDVAHDARAVAQALVGSPLSDDDITRAVDDHLAISEPLGDVQASGEYRVALAKVYGKRALRQARDRARG